MILHVLWIPLLSLIGLMSITALNTVCIGLGKFESREYLGSEKSYFFFFRLLIRRFFKKNQWENFYFIISSTKHILHLFFALSTFFYALLLYPIDPLLETYWTQLLLIAVVIVLISILADFLMRLLAILWTKGFLKAVAPIASIYLFVLFPIVGILLKLTKLVFQTSKIKSLPNKSLTKGDKIREMVWDSEFIHYLEPFDQKLVHSLISFRERVAREIMIPRIDIESLPVDATLSQVTNLFLEEGFSRIPLYKDSLDHIVGVLLYKDLLKFYSEQKKDDKLIHFSASSMMKPVIYTPENKKISQLLQEFKNKQLHLAIVVDEYGGTEGIITIEDILEEIVGEIEDEYDMPEAALYTEVSSGGWIVDAKMNVLDIENKLGVSIPTNPEYETIGGYIFHRAGTIPTKGWKLHHDQFELEILNSNDRCIEKVRIIPIEKQFQVGQNS